MKINKTQKAEITKNVHKINEKSDNDWKQKYNQSKRGVLTRIYNSQKSSSKDRLHEMPKYTKEELWDWLNSQPLFDKLFKEWEASNYCKDKKPSVDRIDDYKTYSFDNIQLMTWEQNNSKGYISVKNGSNRKICRAIIQYSKDGNFIAEHFSTASAARCLNVDPGNINRCCRNGRPTAYGYKWEYKSEAKSFKQEVSPLAVLSEFRGDDLK